MANAVCTVMSVDVVPEEPVEVCAIGSYTDMEDAIDSCVEFIEERMCLRPDIRRAMVNDERHKNACSEIAELCGKDEDYVRSLMQDGKCEVWDMPDDFRSAIREYLRPIVSVEDGYEICSRNGENFIFSIGYNPLDDIEE